MSYPKKHIYIFYFFICFFASQSLAIGTESIPDWNVVSILTGRLELAARSTETQMMYDCLDQNRNLTNPETNRRSSRSNMCQGNKFADQTRYGCVTCSGVLVRQDTILTTVIVLRVVTKVVGLSHVAT